MDASLAETREKKKQKKTQTINIIKVFVTRILMMIIYMDGNIDCDRLINANTIIEYRIEIDMQHFLQSNRICNKCSVAIKYVPIYCVNASRLNLFDPFFFDYLCVKKCRLTFCAFYTSIGSDSSRSTKCIQMEFNEHRIYRTFSPLRWLACSRYQSVKYGW